MTGLDLLADTNALIYFLNGDSRLRDLITDNVIHVSFITEIELLSKPGLTKKEEKIISGLISDCVILGYTEQLKAHIVNFRRAYKLKMPDALIAATACYYQIPLITADAAFSKVKEITVIQITN